MTTRTYDPATEDDEWERCLKITIYAIRRGFGIIASLDMGIELKHLTLRDAKSEIRRRARKLMRTE